jgi:hypothetical protein
MAALLLRVLMAPPCPESPPAQVACATPAAAIDKRLPRKPSLAGPALIPAAGAGRFGITSPHPTAAPHCQDDADRISIRD